MNYSSIIFKKTLNKNEIKGSYSCMENIKNIHNKTIYKNHKENIPQKNYETSDGCNCRNKK